MATTALPGNGNQNSSPHGNGLERQLWIVDLLTALAIAFGQGPTAERLQLNAADLDDIPLDRLQLACEQARRECEFYPPVAKLRQFAGADAKLQTHLEAEQAWQLVMCDLARRGRDAAPGLSDRIEYAIRCVGGRRAIDRCFKDPDVTTETFKKKDFVAAFANYDAAVMHGLHRLPESVRQLLTAGGEDRPKLKLLSGSKPCDAPAWKPRAKPIPRPLSDDEVEARRALLAEQARKLKASG